jgi:hypothetical protein
MAKKNNTTLFLILGAAAVVGYLYYKKSLTTPVVSTDPRTLIPGVGQLQTPVGIATEQPSASDIGIIAPALDPTGMQINFM